MDLNNTVYYSVTETAALIGRSKDWLWAQCRDRKVPHHKRGRSYVFTEDDISAIARTLAPVPVEVEA